MWPEPFRHLSSNPHENPLKFSVHHETTPIASVAVTNSHGAIDTGIQRRTLWKKFKETAGHKPWSFSTILAAIWIGGACGTAVAYAVRIRRFEDVIRNSEAASPALGIMVTQLSRHLGLKRVPDILMTSHALPPLVWSIGFFPRLTYERRSQTVASIVGSAHTKSRVTSSNTNTGCPF